MSNENLNGSGTAVLPSPAAEESPNGHSGDSNDYSRFENLSDDSDDDKPAEEANSADCADKLQQIGEAKVKGNEFVAKADWKLAARQYRKGLKVVTDMSKLKPGPNPAQISEAKELELSLQLNLAMAELKLENWAASIKAATKASEIDPSNVKAFFRRGQAQAKVGCLDEAVTDFSQCLKLDPNNGSAKKELASVKKRQAAHKAASKKSFSGLFDRAGGVYDDREEERKAKAAEKAKKEAERRQQYEDEMAEKEKEAATQLAAEHGEGTPEVEAGDGETPEVSGGSEEASKEEEGASGFERPSYEEWCKQKDKEKADKEKAEEDAKRAASSSASPSPSSRAPPSKVQRSTSDGSSSSSSATELELDDEDVALIEELKASGGNRGYKVTADGRKTTYFNNDLDDEARKLIGDIAPQKITSPPNDPPPQPTPGGAPASSSSSSSPSSGSQPPKRIDKAVPAGGGGSAWNSGGTWEEKDCTEWAKGALKTCLKRAKSASGSEDIEESMSPEALVKAFEGTMKTAPPASGGDDPLAQVGALAAMLARVTAKVTKVAKVEGDASVAVVRGTKRFLFDLTAELDYEVLVDESFGMDESADSTKPARQATYKGKLSLSDITHDAGESGVEFTVKPKTVVPANHTARVTAVLEGLKKDVLKKCIPSFATEFQAIY